MTRSPGDRVAADLAATGGPVPDVVIEPDPDRLSRAVAEALVARLAAAQAVHGTASVVLTGGGIGIAVLERVAALAAEPVRETVDWTAVDVWWGDERFVPAGDAERNEGQARTALLDRVGVPAERVHAMPAADSASGSPEAAAEAYLAELQEHADGGTGLPRFDVLLLGMGPEGHTASIFPGSPAVHDERPVLAVRDCPKPPPTRISLGYPAINSAEEVWVVVTGEGKAEAVAAALGGADPVDIPAAGVHGTRATRWLLDAGAASRLPRAAG
ncbi:6-phosphogluconolactonase [Blastococcus sp. SYSU DS0533]